MTFTFATAGIYYVLVAQWDRQPDGGAFTSKAPAAGQTYTLHVSAANHAVVPLTLIGSTLYGGDGDDTITGGAATTPSSAARAPIQSSSRRRSA